MSALHVPGVDFYPALILQEKGRCITRVMRRLVQIISPHGDHTFNPVLTLQEK